jgi:hypothetical protein
VTILLVEQNAPAALSLANYGYVLEVGKIVLENTGKACWSMRTFERSISARSEFGVIARAMPILIASLRSLRMFVRCQCAN